MKIRMHQVMKLRIRRKINLKIKVTKQKEKMLNQLLKKPITVNKKNTKRYFI